MLRLGALSSSQAWVIPWPEPPLIHQLVVSSTLCRYLRQRPKPNDEGSCAPRSTWSRLTYTSRSLNTFWRSAASSVARCFLKSASTCGSLTPIPFSPAPVTTACAQRSASRPTPPIEVANRPFHSPPETVREEPRTSVG